MGIFIPAILGILFQVLTVFDIEDALGTELVDEFYPFGWVEVGRRDGRVVFEDSVGIGRGGFFAARTLCVVSNIYNIIHIIYISGKNCISVRYTRTAR